MNSRMLKGLIIGLILVASGSAFAETEIHGYLRHQTASTFVDGEIIRNVTTAEVALEHWASEVDLFVSSFVDLAAVGDPVAGIREAYIDYFAPSADLRIGKQIVIWGVADGLAITDIVSPKDLRNFLIPDFLELRMAVVAARASVYLGPLVTEFVYVPVFTPSGLPEPGSIWHTSFDAPVTPIVNPAPSIGLVLSDGEFYGRLRWQAPKLDFDVAGGYYWTNEPTASIEKTFAGPGIISSITVTPEYYRQWIAGVAGSSSVGPFIFRAESAYLTPKRFLTTDLSDPDGYVEADYIQSLLGTDTVFGGIDLSAQVMYQYIIGYDPALQQDEHVWTGTLRLRRGLFREKLTIDAFSYVGFNTPDALVKIGLTWTPVDAFEIRAETDLFFGDSGQFGSYDDNDLAIVSIRYSF